MSEINDGGPVYPFEYTNETSRHQPGFFGTGMLSPGAAQQFAGITLRDHLAALAMASLTPVYWEDFEIYGSGAELNRCLCETAYEMADQMLIQRKQGIKINDRPTPTLHHEQTGSRKSSRSRRPVQSPH